MLTYRILVARLHRCLEKGLSYDVLDSETLLDFGDFINAQDEVIVGPAVDGYEPVKCRYPIDVPARFFQTD